MRDGVLDAASARRRGPADPGDRRLPVVVGAPRAGRRRPARRRARRRHAERAHRRRAVVHMAAQESLLAQNLGDAHDRRPARGGHRRRARTRSCRASPIVSSTTRSRSGATRSRPTGRGPSPTPTAPRSGAASGSPATTRCSCGRSRRGCTPTTSGAPPGLPRHAARGRATSRSCPTWRGGSSRSRWRCPGARTTARPRAWCSPAPAAATGWCRWAAAGRRRPSPT